jgi:hypothetical protein
MERMIERGEDLYFITSEREAPRLPLVEDFFEAVASRGTTSRIANPSPSQHTPKAPRPVQLR